MSPKMWVRSGVLGAVLAMLIVFTIVLQHDAQARDDAKGRKYALLVGVNKYKSSKFTELKYTENDVDRLADLLRDKDSGGFAEVRVLTHTRGKKDVPTAANIREALKALVKGKGSSDTVLIALSGHGLELEVHDPEKDESKKGKSKTYGYFCPHDADLTDEVSYSTGHSASLIHIKEILDALDNCGAGAKLLLMDACRNEMKAEKIARSLDVGRVSIPKDAAALFSCKSGQKAFETSKLQHGVFFHFVLEGLKGKAGANKRGEVTWDKLVDYVKEHVSDEVPTLIGDGARQHPHGVSNLSGNSPALVRPGKDLVIADKTTGFKMEFVLIPATGKDGFLMGSTKAEQDEAIANSVKSAGNKAFDDFKTFVRAEGPRHKVILTKAFYLGKFEVTQRQWKALIGGKNPSYFSSEGGGKDRVKGLDTDNFPVESVSWTDTQDFLKALSKLPVAQKSKGEFRLPTEAEWEYACRGRLSDKAFTLDGKPSDSISSKQANFDGNYPFGGGAKGDYLQRTCKIGSYQPNAFGVYDMHGNAWEWCEDWYSLSAYTSDTVTDPKGPTDGKYRALRGGSWFHHGHACRAAHRISGTPGNRYTNYGFRVCFVPGS